MRDAAAIAVLILLLCCACVLGWLTEGDDGPEADH